MIEAFFASTTVVALAEIGDKTMLLAIVLAAKLRAPWQILAGILVATLANHALAGTVGAWGAALLSADALRWILGLSFLGMAAWMLVPDKLDPAAAETPHAAGRIRRHGNCIFSGRDGRQDADRHHRAGRAL